MLYKKLSQMYLVQPTTFSPPTNCTYRLCKVLPFAKSLAINNLKIWIRCDKNAWRYLKIHVCKYIQGFLQNMCIISYLILEIAPWAKMQICNIFHLMEMKPWPRRLHQIENGASTGRLNTQPQSATMGKDRYRKVSVFLKRHFAKRNWPQHCSTHPSRVRINQIQSLFSRTSPGGPTTW